MVPLHMNTDAEAARGGGRQIARAACKTAAPRRWLCSMPMSLRWAKHWSVPCSPQLNPPLWEVGHVGWFQDYWLARSRQRERGIACDPDHRRPAGRLPQCRCALQLQPRRPRHALGLAAAALARPATTSAASLDETLALLATPTESDDALYFYRLALFHEDMHAEAGIYMAQALDIRAARRPVARRLARAGCSAPNGRSRFRRSPGRSARRRRICLRQRTGAHAVAVGVRNRQPRS
jgi:iron(II)-dependent oxidoreductase